MLLWLYSANALVNAVIILYHFDFKHCVFENPLEEETTWREGIKRKYYKNALDYILQRNVIIEKY